MTSAQPPPGSTLPRPRALALVVPLALLGAILGLRMAYLHQLGGSPLATFLVEDQLVYQRRAIEILSGRFLGTSPLFYSSTLYPYLLAAIYAVTGVAPSAVYLIQGLLGVATCGLVFLLAREAFETRRALVALVLAGLYGPLAFAEGQILMISWSVFAVSLALWAAVRHARTGTWTSALLCGAACGLGVVDKPNLLVLALGIAIGWRLGEGRVRTKSLLALAAGALLFVAPAAAINAAQSGGRVLLSASSGINLAIGNNPLSDGTYTEPWAAEGRDASQFQGLQNSSRHFASRALGRPVDDLEADRYWRKTALEFILDRPLDELRLLGRRILLLINRQEIPNVMSFDFYRSQFPGLRRLASGFWLVGPFGLLAALLSIRGGRGARLLAINLLLYGLGLLPFFVCDRFRLPAVPMLVPLAADGMVTCVDAIVARRWSRAGGLAAGVAGLGVLVGLPLVRFDMSRDHWMLAQAFVESGRPDRAVSEYEAVLAQHPEQAGAWTDLGLVQLRIGRDADAGRSLRRAIQIAPGLGLAHAALADLDVRRGAIDAALAGYRRDVEADQSLESAWLSLARLLQADGESGLAREALLRGRALNPGDASFDAPLREIGAAPP